MAKWIQQNMAKDNKAKQTGARFLRGAKLIKGQMERLCAANPEFGQRLCFLLMQNTIFISNE